MEIEVTQEKLARALGSVSRVAAGAKATLPILSNVLIRAENNRVSLTATNLDMAVVEYVPVIKAKDGMVTVPARLIAEFVSNLPKDEKIKLSVDGVKVKVSAGKYTSTINGVVADDFPELPEIDEKKAVKYEMTPDDFKLGVSEVIPAASGDTTRPAMTGVCFNTAEGNLYVTATDGYRIAEREFISKVSSEVMAIVPVASLSEVLRAIPEDIDEMELLFDETQVRFRMGEIEITSKLIDGTFPNCHEVIPSKMDDEIVLDLSELTRITRMAAVFSREVNQTITCELDKEKKVFVIASISNEVGENRSEMEADVKIDAKIKVDSKYLMYALNAMEEPAVRFGVGKVGAQTGVAVLLQNEKSNKYRHLIMPMDF